MDRRSWLWRRKSSDKSPGETESSVSGSGSGSGSISSPSERFSDDQQAYSNQITPSPEVTSQAAPQDDDVNDSAKILTEKLSAALANLSSKEELVQQHAKVAEEAVTGWEKAEKEVITLKQQLDVANKKNSSLEDRIVHLDGALKECLRQLRQLREEQDQKIQEAISKNSQNSESTKSELETQLADLHAQLEASNAKIKATASLESDLRLNLETFEKENASLQLKLRSLFEELEVRTLERDLSTKTAETASKMHLEGIKKVAKLEAECRRLKSIARKATLVNDHKSRDPFPSNVDTVNNCEPRHHISHLNQIKLDKPSTKNSMTPSDNIDMMDDFLEMERLAAMPVKENTPTEKFAGDNEAPLKVELEVMKNRTAELEKKIEMLEIEKLELGRMLTEGQDKLKLSEASLEQLNTQFHECQNQLKVSQSQQKDANTKLGMLQSEFDLANDLRQAIEIELEDANASKEEVESRLKAITDESKILLSKVSLLEGETEKERALYAETSAKCRALEDEVSRLKCEAQTWKNQLDSVSELKEAVEKECMTTNAKTEEAKSQLTCVQTEAKSLLAKVDSLEDEVQKEKQLRVEVSVKCKRLEEEVSRMKQEVHTWQSRFTSTNGSKEAIERELEMTNTKKDAVEAQLKAAMAEAKSLLVKVGSLENEVAKERALSADFAAKCKKLEDELSRVKYGTKLRVASISKEEVSIQQEKELTIAASKLAECQKTISSLGKQLRSLATFDDLLLESDELQEVSDKELQFSSNKDTAEQGALSSETKCGREPSKGGKEGLSAINLDSKSHRNGFGKLFPRSKSAIRRHNS